MPHPQELARRGLRKLYNKNTAECTSWFYKEEGNQNPYLSLFVAPDAKVYLSARVSLPTFIFGSNVRLPSQPEIEQGLDLLSKYVAEKIGFDFDARTATVWEVHFTKDYFVGEIMMRQIISKLSEMSIPRFNRGGYGDTTLYFHSKGSGKAEDKPRTICIYDKYEDCIKKSFSASDIRDAEGMLRLEFRYKKTDAVNRLVKNLHLPNRQAQTIFTSEVSDTILAPIQRQILLLLEESDSQNRIFTLTEAFGKRRAAALIQFLHYQLCFGNEFYKIKPLEFSRSSYYDCQRDCREVGINKLLDTPKANMKVGDVT